MQRHQLWLQARSLSLQAFPLVLTCGRVGCLASCRPGKDLPGIQDAVLRTAERILGDENPEDGSIKLPHKCQLRMLLYKHQIGMIMGKKGSTINEMRNKSSASIKLLSPNNDGQPIVPCALPDDEMISVSCACGELLHVLHAPCMCWHMLYLDSYGFLCGHAARASAGIWPACAATGMRMSSLTAGML